MCFLTVTEGAVFCFRHTPVNGQYHTLWTTFTYKNSVQISHKLALHVQGQSNFTPPPFFPSHTHTQSGYITVDDGRMGRQHELSEGERQLFQVPSPPWETSAPPQLSPLPSRSTYPNFFFFHSTSISQVLLFHFYTFISDPTSSLHFLSHIHLPSLSIS